jgi:hypothetical protein
MSRLRKVNEDKVTIYEANFTISRQKPLFQKISEEKVTYSEEKVIISFVSLISRRERTFYRLNSEVRLISSEFFFTGRFTALDPRLVPSLS